MFENWVMQKNEFNAEEYEQVADWCNSSGAYTIVENGDYYEVVPVVVPEVEPEVVEDEQIVKDSGL